jgi:uncharacterized protein (DUF779 family)
MHQKVIASPAARQAITALRAGRGPVMFVQPAVSGDPVPLCLPGGRRGPGARDRLLGEVDGCPFYIDAALYRSWREPSLVLDVEAGPVTGFSLPPAPGKHFVLWSPRHGELSTAGADRSGTAAGSRRDGLRAGSGAIPFAGGPDSGEDARRGR